MKQKIENHTTYILDKIDQLSHDCMYSPVVTMDDIRFGEYLAQVSLSLEQNMDLYLGTVEFGQTEEIEPEYALKLQAMQTVYRACSRVGGSIRIYNLTDDNVMINKLYSYLNISCLGLDLNEVRIEKIEIDKKITYIQITNLREKL